MLARTVSRASQSRLRTSRTLVPSQIASSFGAWNSEPLTTTKRPRICIITQQQRTFSTPAASDASLPTQATTGAIASHKAPIPTERDIAMAGGVFSLTSAKRDKLGELKGKLKDDHWSLDDMATNDELLDLHLADGIMLVTKTTDFAKDNNNNAQLKELSEWLDDQEGGAVDRTTLGIRLEAVRAKVEGLLETVPSDRCLRNVRDFLDPTDLSEILKDYNGTDNPFTVETPESSHFWDSVTRYRLLLTKSAIDHVLDSWEMFTTVSDMDVDRAAAEGISLESELDTVDGDKILSLLQACMTKSCSDRITAAWDLMDRDEDGSLDQDEMHKVVHLCLTIEVDAVKQLFEESLEAYPVRAPLDDLTTTSSEEDTPQPKKGWRQKRAEEKVQKKLSKMFIKSCSKHFDVEVEINHRIRCIYAWANKDDQGNQVKSVVVGEQAGWSGRQRYVELSPKISEAEFREVQCLHFRHADKFGSEILGSFREDLWVLQGKRRERKDLYKNSFLFLAGVSAVDYGILCL